MLNTNCYDADRSDNAATTAAMDYEDVMTGNVTREITPSVAQILQILNEREKDLELAAQIGASLLEQNKELQDRNDFLEESLSTSNETITQLKHQIRRRNSLLHNFSVLDELVEEEEESAKLRPTTSYAQEHLESRLKSLEEENQLLKAETNRLEDVITKAEEKESARIKDHLAQLNQANLKITNLQEQLAEKNKKCENQSAEVRRLLQEISNRKAKENTLLEANEDLHEQLGEALENHEMLKMEIGRLQERYLEVMGVLQETDDQLKAYRQRMSEFHRTSSIDSLYDSLASELEASDSGCFNTPMFSARCESQQSAEAEHYHDDVALRSQLTDEKNLCLCAISAAPSTNMMKTLDVELAEADTTSGSGGGEAAIVATGEAFDVPSRALVNAVRNCLLDDELRAKRVANPTPASNQARDRVNSLSNQSSSLVNQRFDGVDNRVMDEKSALRSSESTNSFRPSVSMSSVLSEGGGDVRPLHSSDVNTPLVESMSFSTISCQSFVSVNTIVPNTAASAIANNNSSGRREHHNSSVPLARSSSGVLVSGFIQSVEPAISLAADLESCGVGEEVVTSVGIYELNGKVCRDMSCSPIVFDTAESDCQRKIAPPENASTLQSVAKRTKVALVRPKALRNGAELPPLPPPPLPLRKVDGAEIGVPATSDTPPNSPPSTYARPKLGEPGRPGTRDLEFSIRRLNLRKKLEREYSAFRNRRGLPPSQFQFFDVSKLSAGGLQSTQCKDCGCAGKSPNSRLLFQLMRNYLITPPEPPLSVPLRQLSQHSRTIDDISRAVLLPPSSPMDAFGRRLNDSVVVRRIGCTGYSNTPQKQENSSRRSISPQPTTSENLSGRLHDVPLRRFDRLRRSLASNVMSLSPGKPDREPVLPFFSSSNFTASALDVQIRDLARIDVKISPSLTGADGESDVTERSNALGLNLINCAGDDGLVVSGLSASAFSGVIQRFSR